MSNIRASNRISLKRKRETMLKGLSIERGKYVKIDDKLLKRLKPVEEHRPKPSPFEKCEDFSSVMKEGSKITLGCIEKFSKNFNSDPVSVKMAEIIGNWPVELIALKRSVAKTDNWDYNVKVTGTPKVCNQLSSGRCWKFAALNVLRYDLMKKLSIDHRFEFSQSYLFFYDKIERANLFLEYMWRLRNKDLCDPKVRFFTTPETHFMSDGGDYQYFTNLVNKYGLVPKNIYNDSLNCESTGFMNDTLIEVLNHMALEIFRKNQWSRSDFDYEKEEYMRIIHNLVVKFMGEPPKPNDSFVWSYKDDQGDTHFIKDLTPEKFYRIVVPHESTKITIIHDPRHPETQYISSWLEHGLAMQGGLPTSMINLPLDTFKSIVCESLKNDEPVWFASDVSKEFDYESNTFDTERFDFDGLLGVDMKYSKADMLDVLTSMPSHAMVFNGVDTIDDVDGRTVSYKKWRIENSWGKNSIDPDDEPDNGFCRMSDAYFDKYVYTAVVDLRYFKPEDMKKIMKNSKKGRSYIYKSTDAFGTVASCKHCMSKK